MVKLNFLKVALPLIAMLFFTSLYADNSTTVTTTTTQSATSTDDSSINSNVQSKISQDSSLSGANITASTQQGVVTLDGTAATQAQIDTATNEAKSVTGVKDVKSNVQLSSASSSNSTNNDNTNTNNSNSSDSSY